jgi:hypothetical protein
MSSFAICNTNENNMSSNLKWIIHFQTYLQSIFVNQNLQTLTVHQMCYLPKVQHVYLFDSNFPSLSFINIQKAKL